MQLHCLICCNLWLFLEKERPNGLSKEIENEIKESKAFQLETSKKQKECEYEDVLFKTSPLHANYKNEKFMNRTQKEVSFQLSNSTSMNSIPFLSQSPTLSHSPLSPSSSHAT